MNTVMSSIVSADFPYIQEKYTPTRRFIRDFLMNQVAFRVLPIRVKTVNLENIPSEAPGIVMMNHRGGLDPFVILSAVKPRFLVPLSKIENFSLPIIGWFMRKYGAYPITRGEVDRKALQNTVELLKGGNLVLMAPEGHRQESLGEGKDGLTYVAVKANAAIVPTGINGTREFADNVKHLRMTRVTVTFGKPFRFRTNGQERIPRDQLSQMTREAMYQLAMLLPDSQRGVYSDLSKATTETLEFLS